MAKRATASAPKEAACLEDVVENLATEVNTLSQRIEVLTAAIDDARQEIETALRHLPREQWVPTQPLKSMPRDPLAEDFGVNRNDPAGIPASSCESNVCKKQAVASRAEATTIAPSKPRPASRKKARLDLKLYFESAYADFVRFIGYGGKPLKEVQTFVRELEKKHGRDKVKEVGDAVAVIEGRSEPYTVRLKDEVRRLATQMLGRPPEAEVRPDHDA